jgi:hypothetical protein
MLAFEQFFSENPTQVGYIGNVPRTIAFETSLMDSKGKKNENQIYTRYCFGAGYAFDGLWGPGVISAEYGRL